MKYYIRRDLNEYGPYTLADLQRYVAQGNIVLTDLTRSEGMTDWVPVSQVIGNIPAPAPAYPVAGGMAYGGTPAGAVYGGVAMSGVPGAVSYPNGPVPPDFHWALVLLISFFCGIFQLVWFFVEVSFIKKIRPENRCLLFILSGLGVEIASVVVLIASVRGDGRGLSSFAVLFWLMILGGAALQIVGIFQMRAALLEYYNTVEPIGLRLSGVLTFFFAVYYFQYHFSRIAQWKKTGYLAPQ